MNFFFLIMSSDAMFLLLVHVSRKSFLKPKRSIIITQNLHPIEIQLIHIPVLQRKFESFLFKLLAFWNELIILVKISKSLTSFTIFIGNCCFRQTHNFPTIFQLFYLFLFKTIYWQHSIQIIAKKKIISNTRGCCCVCIIAIKMCFIQFHC